MVSTVDELIVLRSELNSATTRLDRLISSLQGDGLPAGDLAGLPRTVAIERVLTSSERPMRPVEIWAELRRAGRIDDPKMEVQVTTYDLWQRGRIGKVGRGQYVALPS